MLAKSVIKQVLAKALSTGGDFAEIFVENSINNNITLIDGKIDTAVSGRDFGIGIRIFKGFKSVYAYTNDNSLQSMMDTAYKAACAIGDLKENIDINLMERMNTNIHPILYVPSSINNQNKIEVMKRAYKAAKDYSSEIAQVGVNYLDRDQKVLIANSEGLLTEDRRIRTRIAIRSIASNGVENQIGSEAPGRFMGFEMFNHIDVENFAREASKTAITMLHAKNCPAGKMMVAIENGFGGVIFHEACGHALEATAVAKGNSVFCNKLGEQIASTKVTAIDDGTMKNLWGSLNIDDEGTKTRRNVLIENGILKGYMIDKLNARRMNMDPTGSSRRESYRYAPTSRMTNTYIDNGDDDNDAILASISEGLYAKKMGGGSVNPITGDFNFAVAEGYLVKDGKIQEPVRGASLIGKGSDILMKIDMVGKNLAQGQGMCGSESGSIPTNVGQPLIRVSEITVGGR
ncbi:TldD/PmbA family protein [Clostridium sp. MSJ-4]|uniref:TldD/PmbA family protein n=1 Tax=Clostridium simiarum TaxID=2841506 RepID=A0ABS6F393_9CLOT|nr:TldD/PmbA family protein [Clostridium simiarum]MBU5592950.1 TldD/PmbA family protein [Clostridium simiarum]